MTYVEHIRKVQIKKKTECTRIHNDIALTTSMNDHTINIEGNTY